MALELDKLYQSFTTKCRVYIYPSASKNLKDLVEIIYQDTFLTAKEVQRIIDEIESLGVSKDKIKIVPAEREIKITATIHTNHVKALGIDLSELAREIMDTIGTTHHIIFRVVKDVENYLSIRYMLDYADIEELKRIPELIKLITNFANQHRMKLQIRRDYDENSIWFGLSVSK